MNLTFTLQQIRDNGPCSEGWTKLLVSLKGVNTPLDTLVSLGDVAHSNGAADAYWCVRCLDWKDVAVRRKVLSALLPSLRRALAHTQDQRVHDCVDGLSRWCDGEYVDLESLAAWTAWAAWAVAWAAWAARATAMAEAEAAERKQQAAELIAAFPPIN